MKVQKQGQITNKSGDLRFSSGEIFQLKISFFKLKLRYMVNLKHNLCFTKTVCVHAHVCFCVSYVLGEWEVYIDYIRTCFLTKGSDLVRSNTVHIDEERSTRSTVSQIKVSASLWYINKDLQWRKNVFVQKVSEIPLSQTLNDNRLS